MPEHELEKQASANRFVKFDFDMDQGLLELLELAAEICGAGLGMVSLAEPYGGSVVLGGLLTKGSDRRALEKSCADAQRQGSLVVAPAEGSIGETAGVPLYSAEGHLLGCLCIGVAASGSPPLKNLNMLPSLARQATHLIEFGSSIDVVKRLFIESKKSEIELRSFFDSSVDHHLLLGKDFEILAFNGAWSAHVASTYGLQMAKGEQMTPFIKPGHLQQFRSDYLSALSGRLVQEERNLSHQGRDSWRLVKFEPARDGQGQIIGVSVNVADVNLRVEHQEALQKQEKQLERIAFVQSHELRAPVASIMGLMSLLEDSKLATGEEWSMLGRATSDLDAKIRRLVGGIDLGA